MNAWCNREQDDFTTEKGADHSDGQPLPRNSGMFTGSGMNQEL
ncbi:hypothetical protein HMPREF9622_00590 [Cutibacterium modestum HL037PA3]|uniref:Uncharacterized protein n=1 Tax=Cutibacterium modestum HL044PA1 TaxID=765109 RepID=A0ABN0C8Q3_9ACTN|nr:hypothetical protein HMPREF9621_01119 [Cutibacterium modestum HL037PA2]EFS93691.1 hypothetical protein HMPREF9607_00145 [Cutibacterium modestum HL044PA1]EFT16385.1 hypothetical protein HMPREF9622_00590 [Cutibacterium modestum HL037PA3]EGG27482.1 hypothetical protein PA08_0748 [Cutibacterium modestum P08]